MDAYEMQLHREEFNLPETVQLVDFKDHDDWLRLRTASIGGSDIGAIMGLNPYSSPRKIFKTKITKDTTEFENVYTRKGKDLEPVIRENYVIPHLAEMGYVVRYPEFIITNPDYPHVHANCDGIAVPDTIAKTPEDNIIIEIKWVSEYAEERWNGDEYSGIPASYYAQVQHYMLITGARKAIVCALFDSTWTVNYYTIKYDSMFVMGLLKHVDDFWNCILTGTPPKPIASVDKDDIIYALKTPKEVTHPADEEMTQLALDYVYCVGQRDALTKQLSAMSDRIADMYLDGHRPNTDLVKVSISNCTRTGFDANRCKEEHPELVNEYTVKTEYVRTSIRKTK